MHFPIGLLVVYSCIEIAAYFWARLRVQTWLFGVKAFLLFAGILAALAALATGGIAEDLIQGTNPRAFILEVHSPFAVMTTILYLVLAAAYLVRVFDKNGWGNRVVGIDRPFIRIWNIKKYLTYLVLDTWLLPALALLSLVGMVTTGALGAAIVYGPDIDPLVSFVYHLFWVQ